MNALTTQAPGTALALPRVSRALSEAASALLEPVARYVDPDAPEGDKPLVLYRDPPSVTESDRQEAEWALGKMGDTLAQATPDALRTWLKPINAGVRNPQDAAAFALRCTAIVLACDGIPAGALTPEAQRDALRTFEFFPSAPEVHNLLTRHANPIRRMAEGLRRVRDAADAVQEEPVTGPVTRTPEEVAHARAQVEQLKRDMASKRPAPSATSTKARRLTPQQLLQSYQTQVEDGRDPMGLAAMHIAHIRQQHGEAVQ